MGTAVKCGEVTSALPVGYTVPGLCPTDTGYFSLLHLSPVTGACDRLVLSITSRNVCEVEARVLRFGMV